MPKISGQAPFTFSLCEDFSVLPERARPFEVDLHGGFAVDPKPDGSIYYGMPGCGLMRISADLAGQEVIELPTDLTPMNFHSTKIMEFDGKQRLVMPANADAMVVVLGLDGNVDFRLSRPEFDEYRSEEVKFNPTDTAFADDTLFVADGYGANCISAVDVRKQEWTRTFAGKTSDPHAEGLFGTAHGLAPAPDGHHLSVADGPHSRFQLLGFDGHFHSTHSVPDGCMPRGIDFQDVDGRTYALVATLDDPQAGRAGPIYVIDPTTYEILSTVRPKEDLGVELADHIHNAVWYQHAGQVYLICQAWNPGRYFVLAREG